MKKNFKLVLALVVAIMMVLGSVSALAANKITISAATDDSEEHTYVAYKIFNGEKDGDQLKNLSYATGVVADDLIAALKADSTIGDKFTSLLNNSAATVAAAMAGCTSEADSKALASVIGNYAVSAGLTSIAETGDDEFELDDGYYVVRDESTGLKNATKSAYMLQVNGDASVQSKNDTVTLTKKVDDKNDSTTSEDAIEWQDTADYDVGDTIPYKLTGTLPSRYADYDFFDYTFKDTMDPGLTLNQDSIVIKYYADAAAAAAGTKDGSDGEVITTNFSYTKSEHAFTAAILSTFNGEGDDAIVVNKGLKGIAGIDKDSVIVVYYTATLNENAVVGNPGNANTSTIEFSNNPEADSKGDNTKSETPEDKNIVFTYDVKVDKVDENNAPLEGAGFTLYKEVADSTTEGAKTGSEIATALDTSIKTEGLTAAKYYVVVGTFDASLQSDGKYTASFQKLDDGNYVLVETKVPAGYNAWESKSFTIAATHTSDDDGDLEVTSLTGNGALTLEAIGTSALTTSIENNSGVVLPSTGGIGTTIFYVAGSIMVLAAAILLITKRRMGSNE